MRYEIVPYETCLKEAVVSFQQGLWGDDHAANRAYFEWKYEENPFLDRPCLSVALHDGKIVGVRGMCGAAWEVDGQTISMPCATDLHLARAHRGRGLLRDLTDAALRDLATRGCAHAVNTSPGPATVLAFLALGWRHLGSLDPVVWRRSPVRFPRLRRAAKTIRPLVGLYRRWERRAAAAVPEEGAGRFATVPCPAAMAELVRRIGGDGRIRHVRDERFFAWRYRSPLSRFRFLTIGDERLEGYLILQSRPETGQYVTIADWEATSEDVRAELLDAALASGLFHSIRAWGATPRDLLASRGFEAQEVLSIADATPTVMVGAIGPDTPWTVAGRDLGSLADWDLRPAYSDARG